MPAHCAYWHRRPCADLQTREVNEYGEIYPSQYPLFAKANVMTAVHYHTRSKKGQSLQIHIIGALFRQQ